MYSQTQRDRKLSISSTATELTCRVEKNLQLEIYQEYLTA
jgi:hypothetical protein